MLVYSYPIFIAANLQFYSEKHAVTPKNYEQLEVFLTFWPILKGF